MRSLLLVPLDDAARIDAAFATGADALAFDLTSETRDASTRERLRHSARDVLRSAQFDSHRPSLYLRIADLDRDGIDEDLGVTMLGEPDGILLASCRSAIDVQHLGAKLAVHEAEYGFADGETGIIAEGGARAQALFTLGSYAESSLRLQGLSWNLEQLAEDLGYHDALDGVATHPSLETARHLVLFAARAADVAAIDSCVRGLSPDQFSEACRASRRLGFNAKLARTAEEVAIINAAFGHEGD